MYLVCIFGLPNIEPIIMALCASALKRCILYIGIYIYIPGEPELIRKSLRYSSKITGYMINLMTFLENLENSAYINSTLAKQK